MPPVVGTVVFTPSNLITAGADRDNDTGFRIAPVLAQAIASEFRITLYSGSISAMGLDSVWFGKASSGQTATAALSHHVRRQRGGAVLGPALPLYRQRLDAERRADVCGGQRHADRLQLTQSRRHRAGRH